MAPLPLRYWGGIAVVSALVFAVLNSWQLPLSTNEHTQSIATTPLGDHSQSQQLVLIGNSLLGYGAAGANEFQQMLSANGQEWQVVKIIKSGINPRYFVPLLTPLAHSKPNVVIIQLENFYRSEPTSRLATYHQNISNLHRYLQAQLSNSDIASPDDAYDHVQCSTRDELTDTQYRAMYQQFTPELQAAAFAPYLTFIATIKAQGGQVVLLEMGRSPKAEQHLGHVKRDQINRITEQLAQLAGVDVWRFPTELTSQQDFCDNAHLAPSGRRIFMHWLLPRLLSKGHNLG